MVNKEQYYNSKHKEYRTSGGREERILSLIPENVKTVLDIGCGSGNLARTLVQKGYTVSGADISSSALESVKSVLSETFCFDVESETWPLELTDKKFDLIIASEIIEHIFSPQQFLKLASQLLKPGGFMIITTPNFMFWKNRLKMTTGHFRYEEKGLLDFGHIRFFTHATVKELFRNTKLKILKERHFYPNLYQRNLNFLGDMFPGLFAYQFIFMLRNEQ